MNVSRMRLMGADVEAVSRGNQGLAEAVDAAMEDLVANTEKTHYLVGSAVGPDPFPRMVREFQSVIPALEPSHAIALATNSPRKTATTPSS